MKIFEITQNTASGNALKAEVYAPTADKAIEEFSNGRYRNDEVTRSDSKVEEFTIKHKKEGSR